MKNQLYFLLGFVISFSLLAPFAHSAPGEKIVGILYAEGYNERALSSPPSNRWSYLIFQGVTLTAVKGETSEGPNEYSQPQVTGFVCVVNQTTGNVSKATRNFAHGYAHTSLRDHLATWPSMDWDTWNSLTVEEACEVDIPCAQEQPEDAQWMTVPNYRDPPPWCFDGCEYVQSTVNPSGQPIGVTYATGQSSDCTDPSECDDYTNAYVYSSGEQCDSGDYNYNSPSDPPSCDQLENECYQRCGGLVEFFSCDPPGCRCQVPPPPAPPGPPVPPAPPDPGTPNNPYDPDPDGDPYTGDFGEGPEGEGDSTCVTCDPETESCDDPDVVYCDEDGNTPCDPATENCGGDDPYDGPDSGTPVQDDPDNPGNELPVTLKDPSAGTCPPGKICIGDGICQPGEDPTSADCVSGTYIIDRWNQFISETNVPFSGLTDQNLNIGSGSAIQTVDLGGLGGEVTFDWSEFDNVWLIIKTVLLIVFSWIGIRIIALKR